MDRIAIERELHTRLEAAQKRRAEARAEHSRALETLKQQPVSPGLIERLERAGRRLEAAAGEYLVALKEFADFVLAGSLESQRD